MAILHLEDLDANYTSTDDFCPKCKTTLQPVIRRSLKSRVISIISLGTVKAHIYKCHSCNKAYTILE